MDEKLIETKAREQHASICGVDVMAINMFSECMVSDKRASINMPDNMNYEATSSEVSQVLIIKVSKNNKPFCVIMYSFSNDSYHIDFAKRY